MGPDGINAYTAGLRNLPFVAMDSARDFIDFLVLHIITAIKLTRKTGLETCCLRIQKKLTLHLMHLSVMAGRCFYSHT